MRYSHELKTERKMVKNYFTFMYCCAVYASRIYFTVKVQTVLGEGISSLGSAYCLSCTNFCVV